MHDDSSGQPEAGERTQDPSARRLRSLVCGAASRLDPATVAPGDAVAMLAEWAAIEHAAGAVRLMLGERAATGATWKSAGARSAEDWLAKKTGTSTGKAKNDLATARRLAKLPDTAEAAKRGELSGAQTEAIAGAADANPGAEGSLLGAAGRESLGELKSRCDRTRAAADTDPEATRRRIHGARKLKRWAGNDGLHHLMASGPAETLAAIDAAMGPFLDAAFTADRTTGKRHEYEVRAFDALAAMAASTRGSGARPTPSPASAAGTTPPVAANPRFDAPSTSPSDASAQPSPAASPTSRSDGSPPTAALDLFGDGAPSPSSEPTTNAPVPSAAGQPASDGETPVAAGAPAAAEPASPEAASSPMPTPGGAPPTPPPTPTPSPLGSPPGPRRSDPRYKIIVRADLAGLVRGHLDGDEVCEIAGIGAVPVTTVRDLLGDATLHLVLTKGTAVANVTHLGRGPTAAQRIALLWQAPRCTREGCANTARLETDHRYPWARDRVTRLDNLDNLCHHDHALKTRQGWALVTGTGRRPMVGPHHPDHPRHTAVPVDGSAHDADEPPGVARCRDGAAR